MRNYIILFFLLIPFLLFSQHSISGKFSPAKEYEFVILYRITASKIVYVTDTTIDQDGSFLLEMDADTEPGIFKMTYKLPEEVFNFDIIYNGKEDITLSYSQGQGVTFHDGQNKILQDYLKEMSATEEKIAQTLESNEVSKQAMEGFFAKQKMIHSKAEGIAGPMTSICISALKPYIPDTFENKSTYQINKKSNFFDNFNFDDPRLQASPFAMFLIKKYYYEFVTLQDGMGYRDVINDIYRETKSKNGSFNKELMKQFWIYLMTEGKQNAANYLSERFLIALAKADDDMNLASELEQIANTAVGATAPNFDLKGYDETRTLHDLDNAQFYLLVFWSSDCSHCVVQVPEVHEAIKHVPSNKLKTIAIGLEAEDDVWIEMTKNLTSFINVLALGEWRNNLALEYNITGTPTYMVLDNSKKILVKPNNLNHLIRVIEAIKEEN